MKRHGEIVTRAAKRIDPELKLEIMGSYRRGAKDCGDVRHPPETFAQILP